MRPVHLLVALTMALTACRDATVICVGVGSPTAIVTVVDSVTSAPLARAARVILFSVERVDSLPHDVLNDSTLAVGPGWPATYRVEVRVPSYRLWARSGVHVPDRCGTLEPARVRAPMQRTPDAPHVAPG